MCLSSRCHKPEGLSLLEFSALCEFDEYGGVSAGVAHIQTGLMVAGIGGVPHRLYCWQRRERAAQAPQLVRLGAGISR